MSISVEAKARYDRGISFCEQYMFKGGIGDGAYVAIRRGMEEFKTALSIEPKFHAARLALADCYFCCPISFSLDPFDAALMYQRVIKEAPELVVDKEQASTGNEYLAQSPDKGYEAAVAYRKALNRKPVVWR